MGIAPYLVFGDQSCVIFRFLKVEILFYYPIHNTLVTRFYRYRKDICALRKIPYCLLVKKIDTQPVGEMDFHPVLYDSLQDVSESVSIHVGKEIQHENLRYAICFCCGDISFYVVHIQRFPYSLLAAAEKTPEIAPSRSEHRKYPLARLVFFHEPFGAHLIEELLISVVVHHLRIYEAEILKIPDGAFIFSTP